MDLTGIKNIIFDFGGVICNLDLKRSEKEFLALGLTSFDNDYSVVARDTLFGRLEAGTITPAEFRISVRQFFTRPVSDNEIDAAWNAMLLDIPAQRIRLIEKLAKHYRVFLLSNSNEIHYHKYRHDLQACYGYTDFNQLFEKAYFSYQIHLKKPGVAIFEYVLRDSDLVAGETFFIDDTLRHVEGARAAGIHGHHLDLTRGDEVVDLFGA